MLHANIRFKFPMTRSRLTPVVFALCAILSPLAASAQGVPQPAPAPANPTQSPPPVVEAGPAKQAMAACRGDMISLCAGVERGGGKKVQCLKDNEAKLSAPCKSALQAVVDGKAATGRKNAQGPGGAAHGKVQKACEADIATVCSTVEKGKGGIGRCLKDNAAKLSPICAQVVADRQAMAVVKKGARTACAADRQTLCAGAGKGKAVFLCLRDKQSQVSPGCQQALASLPEPRKGKRPLGASGQAASGLGAPPSGAMPAPAPR